MKPEPFADLEHALSFERFGRYLAWSADDRTEALELYALNMRLSAALYVPLQMLEIVLRNRIHAVMTEVHGPEWFLDATLVSLDKQRKQVASALEGLSRDGKDGAPGRVVASLTFGFWTAMLSSRYEDQWQQYLRGIAQKENGKGLRRKEMSSPLFTIREIRNRVAHHEPIIDRDLPKHYGNMIRLTRWMSPAAANWTEHHSTFHEIFPPAGIRLFRPSA